jgi:hypothetical protein
MLKNGSSSGPGQIGMLCVCLLLVHLVSAAERTEPRDVLQALRQPPKSCTQVPFWFWNGNLDPAEFRAQLREMADKGVYAAMPHPRFGMDRREYLEEPYWRAMQATLAEAKKLGMQIWLYDEYNWPSGGAGGRVTDGHPELYPRGLDYLTNIVEGPQELVLTQPAPSEPRMEVFEKFMGGFIRLPGAAATACQPWGEVRQDGRTIAGNVPAGRCAGFWI